MVWVVDGDFVGVVFKVGGLGIIGGGNVFKEVVKVNIDKIKFMIDKFFGVNIMFLLFFVDDIVDLVIEEGVKVVMMGVGNFGKYMECFYEVGIIVIFVVFSVVLVKCMEKLGVDVIIIEGMEVGGYIGKLIMMILVW